jgi:hypothetical protein
MPMTLVKSSSNEIPKYAHTIRIIHINTGGLSKTIEGVFGGVGRVGVVKGAAWFRIAREIKAKNAASIVGV